MRVDDENRLDIFVPRFTEAGGQNAKKKRLTRYDELI